MKDVLLIETLSGGDIGVNLNDIIADERLSNILYLSLVGGNVGYKTQISKSGDFRNYYWGNEFTLFRNAKMDSGFEYALRTTSLTSGARVKLEQIATEDLKCLLKYFQSYSVNISMVYVDHIKITIKMVVTEGQSIERSFTYKKNENGDYSLLDYNPADYYAI